MTSDITISNAAAKLALCWSTVNGFMRSSRNKTQTDKILSQPNLCMKSQHASVRFFRFVTHWISTSPATHQAHIGLDQTKLESTTFGNPVTVLWLAERIKKKYIYVYDYKCVFWFLCSSGEWGLNTTKKQTNKQTKTTSTHLYWEFPLDAYIGNHLNNGASETYNWLKCAESQGTKKRYICTLGELLFNFRAWDIKRSKIFRTFFSTALVLEKKKHPHEKHAQQ